MISIKHALSLITIVAALFVVIRSEISDLNPPPNICLCVSIHNCNVRDSACGNVFDQAPHDGCYIYTGQKTECILSGNVAQFFETIYYGQSGWIFGSNLILGTGPECGITDECAEVSCQNGGSCYNTLSGSVCMCTPGFEGLLCQINVNECESLPCMNGGTCVDQVNRYVCNCVPGYTGTYCETVVQCPDGFFRLPGYNVDSCYQIVYDNLVWEEAQTRCRSLVDGSHLIVIEDESENSAVVQYLNGRRDELKARCGPDGSLWSSGQLLTRGNCDSGYVWTPYPAVNVPMTFTSWADFQPSCGGDENSVQLWHELYFQWDDTVYSESRCSLCEYDNLYSDNN